jgi:chemotaxis signal transduction protein
MAIAMADKRTDQLCTFRLGNLFLGIDVLDVREVLQTAEITEVPHAHEAVEGLINLRGQIATAINLRRRLEVEHEVLVSSTPDSAADQHEPASHAPSHAEAGDEGGEEHTLDLDDVFGAGSDAEAAHESTEANTLAHSLNGEPGSELADRSGLPLHVVIMSDDEPVTLMVDAIGDVVDVDRTTYEVPPPTLTGPARRFIRGAYKMDGELLLLLDLQRLVTLEDHSEVIED